MALAFEGKQNRDEAKFASMAAFQRVSLSRLSLRESSATFCRLSLRESSATFCRLSLRESSATFVAFRSAKAARLFVAFRSAKVVPAFAERKATVSFSPRIQILRLTFSTMGPLGVMPLGTLCARNHKKPLAILLASVIIEALLSKSLAIAWRRRVSGDGGSLHSRQMISIRRNGFAAGGGWVVRV